MRTILAILTGFVLDLLIGDPHSIPHPVSAMGWEIAHLETALRRLLPKTPTGERCAGLLLWILMAVQSWLIPAALLYGCGVVHPVLQWLAESIMCWQILAVKSLRVEAMKVHETLKKGTLEDARKAVSMIVGRDTAKLERDGVIKAAVETVAENTADGVVAPLVFLALGGAPLGFLYKAVNTMDSMLGYTDPPYTNIGLVPARMDDLFNFIPARLSALLFLVAGGVLGLDVRSGWCIFRRDRYNHASPNSAQTESACAGLLRVQLAGDAWYHGILHKKPTIGDDQRPIRLEDIPRTCAVETITAGLALILVVAVRFTVFILT